MLFIILIGYSADNVPRFNKSLDTESGKSLNLIISPRKEVELEVTGVDI